MAEHQTMTKSISTALQALFTANTAFLMADFYTITLTQGPILYYTSADVSLTWNGQLYTSLGPKISRNQVKVILGVQVASLDIDIFPEMTDLVLGLPFYQQVINGTFDGAWISLDRVFLTTWTTSGIVGSINMFSGKAAGALVGRTTIKLTVKSPLELANMNLPRNTVQQGCQHNLFDAGCKVSKTAFQYSGSCVGPQGPIQLILSTVIATPNYFTLGYIQFTSGLLNGLWRSITSSNVAGAIQVSWPFPVIPSAGDTYIMFPGCDHQKNTCIGKFNNVVHFRGFPYVPAPTTAI